MAFKQIYRGRKFKVHAWVNTDGQCEIEEFLTTLGATSPSDWCKLVSLIEKSAKDGPPENVEVCRLVHRQGAVYEFRSAGGGRVFWFLCGRAIVICSCCLVVDGELAFHSCIAKALLRREEYFEERKHDQVR
jgi:hypothetical protein